MGASYQFSATTMLILRVVSSVLQFIGILVSLFRLWIRLQIRRLWWEDAWAFIACVCATVLLVSEWVYLQGGWTSSVIGFWIYSLLFSCVIWAVRMSILFSIARIAHPTKLMSRTVAALAVFFSLICVVFMAWKVWWYTEDSTWLEQTAFYTRPARWLNYPMYVYELSTDCISDTILIALSVSLLWQMNLRTKRRNMIIAIFSSTIIVTIVSILRAVSQIMSLRSLVGVATDFEAALSIIICNLLVVVTLVYRCFRRVSGSDVTESDSDSDSDFTTPVRGRATTLELTTVDLGTPTCSRDSS